MYTLLVILIVIAALLMIGIVLIQESKGGGLASQFSGYNQIGGVRKTTDFIEKMTWGLAAFMVVVSVFCAYVAPTASNTGVGVRCTASASSFVVNLAFLCNVFSICRSVSSNVPILFFSKS